MTRGRAFLVAAVLAATSLAVAADSDPWAIPAQSGAELTLVIVASKRDYTLQLAGKPWAEANGPDRVEPVLTKEEKDGLTACRDLIAKGDHDGAAKSIDDLLAKNPANWDAFVLRAASLHAKGADKDAVPALRTGLIGNRRNPEAWKLLDDVAKALSKKVARPKLDLRGWVRELGKGEIEVGHVAEDDVDMPWNYYAVARAVYRYEGAFARDFPSLKAYAFTFREQMYAMGVLAASAEDERKDGTKLPADLGRVLAERKAGTLAPFAFFAAWPEPLTATPEPGLDKLVPRLEKYFDERILVRK